MADPPTDGSEPRRAHSRLHVEIEASFETLAGRQKVCLVDLSPAGAHVVLSEPEAISEGVLRWLEFDTFAMAVWQEGEDVGLRFDRLLPPRVFEETRRRAPSLVLEMAQAWVKGSLADD